MSDPHYKKTIEVAMHKTRLSFAVAHDLFSSHDIDAGTRLLLRRVLTLSPSRVLDLGSGYGPLGLFLKARNPAAEVHCVDRDLLAVEYTARNARENGLDVETYASLGFDDVRGGDFDLVVSNIPAKAGDAVIRSMLLDGGAFLAAGGMAGVVVIDRLAQFVDRVLAEVGVVAERASNRGYTSYLYNPPAVERYVSGFQRGLYDRGSVGSLRTVHGLPEFDSLHHATEVAFAEIDALGGAQTVATLNPGQGHVPVHVHRMLQPGHLVLDDRDLLALRASERNLLAAGRARAGLESRAGPLPTRVEGADAVVTVLPEKQQAAVSIASLKANEAAAHIVVGGTSTAVTRVVEALGRPVLNRRRERGFSAVTMGVRGGP